MTTRRIVSETTSSEAMLTALVTTVSDRPRTRRATPGGVGAALGGGRAAAEADGLGVADALGGGLGDAALLLDLTAAAIADRELVEGAVADRAAVRAGEQALLLEQLEVAADGRRRGAEVGGQLGDRDRAGVGERGDDRGEPLAAAHRASSDWRTTARVRCGGVAGSGARALGIARGAR